MSERQLFTIEIDYNSCLHSNDIYLNNHIISMAPPARTLRSNEKDVGSSATTAQNPLPADTPVWGIALYELLNNVFIRSQKEVNQQISDLINISVKDV